MRTWAYHTVFARCRCRGASSKGVSFKTRDAIVARCEVLGNADRENEKHSSMFIRGSARALPCAGKRASSSHRTASRRVVKPLIRHTSSSLSSLASFSLSLSPVFHASLFLFPRFLSGRASPCCWYAVARNRCKPACVHLRTDVHVYTCIHTFTYPVGVVTSGDRYRVPLICHEVERLLSRPPTELPSRPPPREYLSLLLRRSGDAIFLPTLDE